MPRIFSHLHRNKREYLVLGCLFLVLLGHYYLRMSELIEFVSSGKTLMPYFNLSGYAKSPWSLLLPVNIGDNFYRYTTTGLVLMAFLQKLWTYIADPDLSIYLTFFTLSTSLIIITFIIAWKASHSGAFSQTLTICMAFGTQFNGVYSNSSIMILYLFYIFIELNLFCLYMIFKSKNCSGKIKSYFVLSLICVALCWEMWIDYVIFLFCAVGIIYYVSRVQRSIIQFSKLKFVFGSSFIILFVYLIIKINIEQGISEHFIKGKESESVFNYFREKESGVSAIMIEDVISNLITYNYLAFSNYFPPELLSSNSLYYLGDKVSQFQYGYDVASNKYVYFHHIFLWYYVAGAIFMLVIFFIYKVGKALSKNPSNQFLQMLAVVLAMIIFGSFTHLLIKYRPYLSVPLLGYKCIVSILGVTLLMGLVIIYLRKKIKIVKFYFFLIGIWLLIIYGSFYRPKRLSHLGKQVMPATRYAEQPDPTRECPIKNLSNITFQKK